MSCPNLTLLLPPTCTDTIFLLALTAMGMLVMVMVYRHERESRASFAQLHKANISESILLSVLASILPKHAVQEIASLAQANKPLVPSARKYLKSAVIFIDVNMNESQSKSALERVSPCDWARGLRDVCTPFRLHPSVSYLVSLHMRFAVVVSPRVSTGRASSPRGV